MSLVSLKVKITEFLLGIVLWLIIAYTIELICIKFTHKDNSLITIPLTKMHVLSIFEIAQLDFAAT